MDEEEDSNVIALWSDDDLIVPEDSPLNQYIEPNEVMQHAMDEYDHIIVCGITKSGGISVRSSEPRMSDVFFLLERVRAAILNTY